MANTVAITIKVQDADGQKLEKLQHQLDRLKATSGQGGGGFAGFGHDFGSVGSGLGEASNAAERFRESLHVLHPLLASIGIEVGNLRSFGALAGVSFGALAAVLGTTLLVALEKVADAAAKARRSLSDLGIAPEGAEKNARTLNETLETQADRLSKLREATQPKESVIGPGQVFHPTRGALPNELPGAEQQLEKIFRVGSFDEATANKALDQFLPAFAKERGLTPEIARGLPAGVAKAFGEALGIKIDEKSRLSPQEQLARSFEQRGGEFANQQIGFGQARPEQFNELVKQGALVPGAELLRGIQRPENAARTDQQFAELQGKGIASLDDAIGHVKTSLEGLAEKLSGAPVKDAIQGLADVISEFTKELTQSPIFQYLTGLTPEGQSIYGGGGARDQGPPAPGVEATSWRQTVGTPGQAVGTAVKWLFRDAHIAPGSIADYAVRGFRSVGGALGAVDQATGTDFRSADAEAQAIERATSVDAGTLSPSLFGSASAPVESAPIPAQLATEQPIAPGPDFVRQSIRRAQWKKDHPGEPLPEGYADGGLVGVNLDALPFDDPRRNPYTEEGAKARAQQQAQEERERERRAKAAEKQRQDQLKRIASQRIGKGRYGNAQNVGLGPIFDLMKLNSPFLHGTGLALGGLARLFDTGGGVFGPGGPTSDKIPAWLSNGEFVVKARAVERVGLSTLEKLNSLADGGPVRVNGSAMMKRFADGGLADSLSGAFTSSATPNGDGSASVGNSPGPANELHLHLNPDRPPVRVPVDSAETLEAVRREAALSSLVQIVPRQSFVR